MSFETPQRLGDPEDRDALDLSRSSEPKKNYLKKSRFSTVSLRTFRYTNVVITVAAICVFVVSAFVIGSYGLELFMS